MSSDRDVVSKDRSRRRSAERHRDRRGERDVHREEKYSENRNKRQSDSKRRRVSSPDYPANVKRENVSDDEMKQSRSRHPRSSRDKKPSQVKVEREFKRENDESPKEYGRASADEPVEDKKKPDFGLSGKLAEDTNTFRGVVIKYSEPPEARKPTRNWRLYVFKETESLPHIEIHRQSAFLLGRDRKVADIPIDHPSCSKQHAAIQYRVIPFTRADGSTGRRVRPYIMDLESANGTFVNNKKIPPKCYVELLEKDVIKFGFSSREYVLLHADSADSDEEPAP
ncbi:unnamed protein product [Notodromas monacha]|uniref:FHA domain-containing protein n=1 Tax=Notodromas monacha TaxID=399045 RepID=A0A7R9BHY5_9CRUS|nr:unnamed protein product [Notodromas monacha]CAG0914434.1 unnamed protein product [Notodromas monacha]